MNDDVELGFDLHEPASVEFVGGPYDGFLHVLVGEAAELATEISVPVSFNLILAASGEGHGPLLPFRRLASYELELQETGWRYVFTGEIMTVESADVD